MREKSNWHPNPERQPHAEAMVLRRLTLLAVAAVALVTSAATLVGPVSAQDGALGPQPPRGDPRTEVNFHPAGMEPGSSYHGCPRPTCTVEVTVTSLSGAPIRVTIRQITEPGGGAVGQPSTGPVVLDREMTRGTFERDLAPGRYEICHEQTETEDFDGSSGCSRVALKARWPVMIRALRITDGVVQFALRTSGAAIGQRFDYRVQLNFGRHGWTRTRGQSRLRASQTVRVRVPRLARNSRMRGADLLVKVPPGRNADDTVLYDRLQLKRSIGYSPDGARGR